MIHEALSPASGRVVKTPVTDVKNVRTIPDYFLE